MQTKRGEGVKIPRTRGCHLWNSPKAHLKPPGTGAPFPMHQDYGYFPFKNDSMVAAFIHLDDSDPDNGGLAVYPGSHKIGPLEDKGKQINNSPVVKL